MQKSQAIQVYKVEFEPDLAATMHNVPGHLAPTSRKTYLHDARHFARWMSDRTLSAQVLSRNDLVAYRAYLGETYVKATAARMWTVAGRLLDEAIRCLVLLSNPSEGIRGFKAGYDESPHHALKREVARELLEAIDRSTALGKRDYALIMLLLRTGIRRSESAALTLGDLTLEQSYHVAIIRHGKGNMRGFAKIPVEVRQAIDTYQEAVERIEPSPESPLFVGFRKGNHPQEIPISGMLIERVVKRRAQAVGVTLSPRGMRASFITLAFEGDTDLMLVQDAARHKYPRTRRRYQ